MDSKDYLKKAVEALIQGNQEASKEAFKNHLELKSKDMLKDNNKE